jgi:hypothetical protein
MTSGSILASAGSSCLIVTAAQEGALVHDPRPSRYEDTLAL